MNYYKFSSIYKTGKFNGYGKQIAEKRFEILKSYKFSSVLDVGSGPCLLQNWLQTNNIKCSYEAVDIREDALSHCNCPTYTSIPINKSYDLVCLFGTVTYNVDHDEPKNKLLLKTLLLESKSVCNSILLFTVFKEAIREQNKNSIPKDFFVYFSKEEIQNILEEIGIKTFEIIENDQYDHQEYFVICNL